MDQNTVEIKPLTPIWTGNAEGECKILKESGITGSLRWWYEAILRGMDVFACDPTNTKCEEKAHCNACHLFGCTGWSRSFSLEIIEEKKEYAPFLIAMPSGSRRQTFLGYKNGGILNESTIKIRNLKIPDNDIIKLLIKLSTEWGIGARTQTGFGIANASLQAISISEHPKTNKKPEKVNYKLPHPQINQFFFSIIPLKESADDELRNKVSNYLYKSMNDLKTNKPVTVNWESYSYIPSAPWVRKAIRTIWKNNEILRHYLMGFVSVKGNPKPIHRECFTHGCIKEGYNDNRWYCQTCNKKNLGENEIIEKMGSKIYVSHCYRNSTGKWEMKIWGWIPELDEKNLKNLNKIRMEVLSEIKSSLKDEKFWKNCFGLSHSIVDVDNIKWKQDVSAEMILKNGGSIFDNVGGVET